MRKRLNWTIKVRTFILRVHYVLLAIEIILLFIGPGPQGVWILVIAENLFINIPVQRRLIERYTDDANKAKEERGQGQKTGDGSVVTSDDE